MKQVLTDSPYFLRIPVAIPVSWVRAEPNECRGNFNELTKSEKQLYNSDDFRAPGIFTLAINHNNL